MAQPRGLKRAAGKATSAKWRRVAVRLTAPKKVLADEVTAICHGEESAQKAHQTARSAFENGQASTGLPTVQVTARELKDGLAFIDLLVTAGLAASKGEARRLMRGGGVRLNDIVMRDEAAAVSLGDASGEMIKLSAGKMRHALIQIT